MNRKVVISILLVGALAAAAAFGAVAYRSASAAASAVTSNRIVTQLGKGPGGAWDGGCNREELANALGISVDELNAAYQKAYETALSQAVEQGLITQTQADELKADDSALPWGGRAANWLANHGIDFDALLAQALGISVEKLQAAYAQAFQARLAQAVADGKLTQEQADLIQARHSLHNNAAFQTSMQAAYQAAVQQAVKNGVITQAQADLLLQDGNSPALPGPGGFGGMGGGPGGFGGMGGGPGGFGGMGGGPGASCGMGDGPGASCGMGDGPHGPGHHGGWGQP